MSRQGFIFLIQVYIHLFILTDGQFDQNLTNTFKDTIFYFKKLRETERVGKDVNFIGPLIIIKLDKWQILAGNSRSDFNNRLYRSLQIV